VGRNVDLDVDVDLDPGSPVGSSSWSRTRSRSRTESRSGQGTGRVLSRRELLKGGAAVLGAAALAPLSSVLGGCRSARQQPGEASADAAPAPPAERREFPLLDVSGEPYAIGAAIGRRFAREIRQGIDRRRDWFDGLARFAENEGKPAFEAMIEAARRNLPDVLEEARGIAEGARIPFREIMVLNVRSELEAAQLAPGACPGCSTIVVAQDDKLLFAHNEDGDAAYQDLMFLVRILPRSGVRFLALCYPGIVAGNAPALNDRGLAMITNYIGTVAWRPGVPRYFLDRAALEARNIDEALGIVLHPDRAYGFHHVLAAMQHGRPRAVAVEAAPTRSQVRELSGVYVHTNHLVLEDMRDEPQMDVYVQRSSLPRYATITSDLARVTSPGTLGIDDLARLLSSHEGRPYSPCRHPAGDVRGATLACAAFDVPRRRLRLYAGNPCRGAYAEYMAPEPEALA
jgi:isopenicillin-N N-acyltransferase-like protein